MKKSIIVLLCIVFMLSLMVGQTMAKPAWKEAGELPPGLQNKSGPPGQLKRAEVAEPATLTVWFEDGDVLIFDGVSNGQVIKFIVSHYGIVIAAVAEQGNRTTEWVGNGSEFADMSIFDEVTWNFNWTSGGAKGRGRQVLTIGSAEGLLYEVEEPVEPPIDEEPEPEEPIEEEPIEEDPAEEDPAEEPVE